MAQFCAGNLSTTIEVPITDDLLYEISEDFQIDLSNLSGNVAASGNDTTGIGTILDEGAPGAEDIQPGSEDTVYAVLSGPVPTPEGEVTGNFTVNLLNVNGNPVTVSQATNVTVVFSNGTAEDGDYDVTTQVVTIGAGSSSATFTVQTNEDVDFDDETFNATIVDVEDHNEFEAIDYTSGAAGQSPSVEAVILDDDQRPTISVNDVTVNEADGVLTFTVSLSQATGEDVTFDFATSDLVPADALAGLDYTAVSGQGTIAAGGTTVTIDVPITDDLLDELNEDFQINLNNLSANVADSGNDTLGIGTIVDNDVTTTTVTLDDVTVDEAGTITYTASVDNAPQGAFSVTLNNGVVINFADGALTGSSAPQTAQGEDPYVDGENYTVSIVSTSGGNYEDLDTSDTALVTINDTIDTSTVTLSATASTDVGGEISYTATVDNAPQTDLVLTIEDENGVTLGTLTILASQTTSDTLTVTAPSEADTSYDVLIASTNGGGNYEYLDTSATASTAVSEVPVSSALLITNTNVEVQEVRVTIASEQGSNSTGVVEPTEVQGQEVSALEFGDAVVFEEGETYTVTIEHVSGPAVILTDLSVTDSEGNLLDIFSGNAKLETGDTGGEYQPRRVYFQCHHRRHVRYQPQ